MGSLKAYQIMYLTDDVALLVERISDEQKRRFCMVSLNQERNKLMQRLGNKKRSIPDMASVTLDGSDIPELSQSASVFYIIAFLKYKDTSPIPGCSKQTKKQPRIADLKKAVGEEITRRILSKELTQEHLNTLVEALCAKTKVEEERYPPVFLVYFHGSSDTAKNNKPLKH
jgi:hypothetical protein